MYKSTAKSPLVRHGTALQSLKTNRVELKKFAIYLDISVERIVRHKPA